MLLGNTLELKTSLTRSLDKQTASVRVRILSRRPLGAGQLRPF